MDTTLAAAPLEVEETVVHQVETGGETTTTSAVRRPRTIITVPVESNVVQLGQQGQILMEVRVSRPRPRVVSLLDPGVLMDCPRVLHRLMGAGLTLGMVEVHLGEAEEGMWTRIFRPTVMIEPVLTMAVDGEAETCRLLIDIVIGTLLVVAGMEGTGTGGPEAEVPIAIGGIRIEIGESVLRGYRIANATFIGVVNPDVGNLLNPPNHQQQKHSVMASVDKHHVK